MASLFNTPQGLSTCSFKSNNTFSYHNPKYAIVSGTLSTCTYENQTSFGSIFTLGI